MSRSPDGGRAFSPGHSDQVLLTSDKVWFMGLDPVASKCLIGRCVTWFSPNSRQLLSTTERWITLWSPPVDSSLPRLLWRIPRGPAACVCCRYQQPGYGKSPPPLRRNWKWLTLRLCGLVLSQLLKQKLVTWTHFFSSSDSYVLHQLVRCHI